MAIVEYRENNGPFTSIDDLVKVKGIGEKTLTKLKDQLQL
jgi:competence protein ComEA